MQQPSPLKRRLQQLGFTLVEILVVLVVIGMAAGLLTISVGDGSRNQALKTSSRELYNAMNLVLEEAIFTNRQFGLRFDIEPGDEDIVYRYNWLVYDHDNLRWLDANIEDIDGKTLIEGITIELEVDEQLVVIGKQEDEESALFAVQKQEDEEEALQPDLYFISSGELQDFTITLADEKYPDRQFAIQGNLLGQLDFKRPGDEDF